MRHCLGHELKWKYVRSGRGVEWKRNPLHRRGNLECNVYFEKVAAGVLDQICHGARETGWSVGWHSAGTGWHWNLRGQTRISDWHL